MTRRDSRPLRTGGRLWGPERVRLGIPMRELERRSGVGRDVLSKAESGRLIPTGEEYDRVTAVLREAAVQNAADAEAEHGPLQSE